MKPEQKKDICPDNKAGEAELSKPFRNKILDIGHGGEGLSVCPADFQDCFCLVFSHCAPFRPFEIRMHILCHFMLKVCNLLFYFKGLHIKDCLKCQKRFWIFEQ